VAFPGAIIKARLRRLIDALIHGVAIAGIFILVSYSTTKAGVSLGDFYELADGCSNGGNGQTRERMG
jgi:hypothetical protein